MTAALERVVSSGQVSVTDDPEWSPELIRRISQHTLEGDPVYIDFEPDDPDNPFNWTKFRKWRSLGLAFAFATISAQSSTSYIAGFPTMIPELHTSETIALLGNAILFIVASFAPFILAPISEQLGRRSMMLLSNVGQSLLFIPQPLSKNIAMLIAFRAIQGIPASSGNSIVGGFAADLFRAEERGFPMSFFTLLIFTATALGGLIGTWIDVALNWKWVFWFQLIVSGAIAILSYFFLEETRGTQRLAKRAKALTQSTGRLHLPRAQISTGLSVKQQIRLASTRAIKMLFTEPIVLFYSLWVASNWGLVFLFYASIPYVYRQYNFTRGEIGSIFAAFAIGAFLAAIMCHFTDKIYQRDRRRSPTGRAPPESRLYPCLLGAVLTPAAYFMFAWTGQAQVHWIVPTIALVLFQIGIYPIYLAAFSYLADTYEIYASSAVAAQSCVRNILGGCLPLATPALYQHLRYPVAGSILGAVSLWLAPLPFVLFFFGARIRGWSKMASHLERSAIPQPRSSTPEKDLATGIDASKA